MVTYVNVISLLEDIDTSTPAPGRVQRGLVLSLSLIALPPHLVIDLTTLLPLGLCAHCLLSGARRQRLALSFSSSLSVFPHHMLGCGDLDIFSRSPRSPPGGRPPLRLPPQMALVFVGWNPDAVIGDVTHGCRRFVLTLCLTASWLSSVGVDSLAADVN